MKNIFCKCAVCVFAIFLVILFIITARIFILKKILYPIKYQKEVIFYADLWELDRALVFSVINVESKFNKNAKSSAGAVGLMQITSETGKFIAERLQLKDYSLCNIKDNINMGCYYMFYLKSKFNNVGTMLVAYNAGEGKVREWLNNKDLSKDGKTLLEIPYKETREYLIKINKSLANYRKLYSKILDKN